MRARFISLPAFLGLVWSLAAGAGLAQQAKGDAKDKAAIARNAEAFVEAFHRGDAKALAAFWAPEGDYIDQTGQRTHGRDAIEEAFRRFFAEHKGLKVRIDSLALTFPAPGIAIEDGTSTVMTPDGAPPSRVRYTNVHVKKDGQWFLGSVRDAPFVPPTNYPHLRGLEWAVGTWTGAGEKEEHLAVSWADNQNFLHATFATTVKKVTVGRATQWIGWDPIAKNIRAWIFDANGGFGAGVWSVSGKTWTLKTSSVLADGKKAGATYILTPLDADTLTLQATDRTVAGNKLPDTKPVKLKRAQ